MVISTVNQHRMKLVDCGIVGIGHLEEGIQVQSGLELKSVEVEVKWMRRKVERRRRERWSGERGEMEGGGRYGVEEEGKMEWRKRRYGGLSR